MSPLLWRGLGEAPYHYMKLIADSGSTKTDWKVLENGQLKKQFQTAGLNPVVMGIVRFSEILSVQLLTELQDFTITEVEFYGAGCTVEAIPEVRSVFVKLLPTAQNITVASDMLGAARSVCRQEEGIVAILGTGSNSCLYDGKAIVANTPPLGFILGDEGSGAVLGRLFLNALLKNRLPEEVMRDFIAKFGLSRQDVITRVYRGEAPNRFLASLSPFIKKHLHISPVREIVVQNFRNFFSNNLCQYQRPDLAVHCVGSMVFYYRAELEEAAQMEGFAIGNVIKSPIGGLL